MAADAGERDGAERRLLALRGVGHFACQNMMQLSEELTSTENKVSFARQAYNDAVTAYNTKTESVPTNFIAGMFNFKSAVLFEVSSEAEREVVKVSFD